MLSWYTLDMKKVVEKKRFRCCLCGAKRFRLFLYKVGGNGFYKYTCKNDDLCVLKMSYYKKKKRT